jgi:transmembrane sensor
VAAGLLVAAVGLGAWRVVRSRGAAGAALVADETLATRVAEAPRGQAGGRLAVDLPDGTRVLLHAGSRLRYPPTLGAAGAARDVWLDGEGYFEVRHDAARPFRVHARDALAEDLGTRFVVRAYPELATVDVAVAEGVVALRRQPPAGSRRPTGDSAVIRAGQRGTLPVTGGAPTVEPAGDLTRFIGWTAGTLALDGGTLAEALPRFERWYDVNVVLADRRLASRQVVARFRNEPLAQAIDELAIALGARVSRSGRTVTFSGKE